MSYKFDSLMMILNKLDSKETVTPRSLMNDLEVSERSAYRYIQTLQVAGFPIYFDRKKESYVFSEGFSLRKPHLSVEETLALALAKRFLGNFGTGMEQGIAKLEERLANKRIDLPGHIVLTGEPIPGPVHSFLGQIHQAITEYRRIEIVHRSLYADQETTRTVDPYYLFFDGGFWHVRGYCHLRQEPRTFAIDRISSLKVLDEHFIPPRESPGEELSASFGAWIDGEMTEVVVRFAKEIAPAVLRKKWHPSQSTRQLQDGRIEMTFAVRGTGGIKLWLYRWIPYCEVVAPGELRHEIAGELRDALKAYEK